MCLMVPLYRPVDVDDEEEGIEDDINGCEAHHQDIAKKPILDFSREGILALQAG